MNPKVEYRVVSADDEKGLNKVVNALLDEGWELHGGVSCALSETDDVRYTLFAQAMTRRDPSSGPIIRVMEKR